MGYNYILPSKKADELNIVMPRVSFIETYIEGASANSKKVKEGKIKVPSNVNIIPLDPVIPNTKQPADYSVNNHAPALDYGNKMFNQVWDRYKGLK